MLMRWTLLPFAVSWLSETSMGRCPPRACFCLSRASSIQIRERRVTLGLGTLTCSNPRVALEFVEVGVLA